MRQAPILRFLSKFSSLFGYFIQRENTLKKRSKLNYNHFYKTFLLFGLFSLGSVACEQDSSTQPQQTDSLSQPLSTSQTKTEQAKKTNEVLPNIFESQLTTEETSPEIASKDSGVVKIIETDAQPQLAEAQSKDKLKLEVSKEAPKALSSKKTKKKNKKCRRGIHKGHKTCQIKRGHISLYHINKGHHIKDLQLVDDQQRIIPEARQKMLELLGDWRAKKSCKVGFSFNYEYKGQASWKMYQCYVQDRLLWYLYLVGHHFDSEIQIVSGLRANERKSSRHHNGHAVDFKVKGVKAKEVWEYCKRTFPLVGIGYYPTTQFVHLDVGRDHHQAFWIDRSGSGEEASYKKGVSQVQKGRAQKSQAGMIRSIKRSLTRHYQSFKKKQKVFQERQKQREARAKLRAKKKRKARSKKKKK